jgi:hypothetical protein
MVILIPLLKDFKDKLGMVRNKMRDLGRFVHDLRGLQGMRDETLGSVMGNESDYRGQRPITDFYPVSGDSKREGSVRSSSIYYNKGETPIESYGGTRNESARSQAPIKQYLDNEIRGILKNANISEQDFSQAIRSEVDKRVGNQAILSSEADMIHSTVVSELVEEILDRTRQTTRKKEFVGNTPIGGVGNSINLPNQSTQSKSIQKANTDDKIRDIEKRNEVKEEYE